MVDIPKVTPERQEKVFAAANAYLQAMLSGKKRQIAKKCAEWEAIADEDQNSEVKNE